jgi:phenylpyruvate tautomerase PptA (4-oxalocrotonate tautomerase family)
MLLRCPRRDRCSRQLNHVVTPTRKDQIMPLIRVTYPENALTAEQTAKLAPLLIDAIMVQEVNPISEEARNGTFVVFEELPPGKAIGAKGQPFWFLEAFVDAPFFTQARRDAAQLAVGKVFVEVLGDDGSSVERAGKTIAPAYLTRLYSLMIEIPEGSWGWMGHTTSALEIGQFIGTDKDEDPNRWSELKDVTAKMTAARVA